MPSKWINEISEFCDRQGSGADAFFTIEEILNRIDKLLRRARLSTDDERLHDDISKELKEV